MSKLTNCARCGNNHEVEWIELKKPMEIGNYKFTHWCLCPDTDDPILMYIVKVE